MGISGLEMAARAANKLRLTEMRQ